MPNDFLPNVKCPHCGGSMVVAISGFGGELNVREKFCTKCNNTFFVQLLVQTTTEKKITDGEITNYKHAVTELNKQRKKTLAEQLLKYEVARRLNDEALATARKMRDNSHMN